MLPNIINAFIFFNVFVYCSYIYSYFFNVGTTSFKPLYWYFFTLGTAIFAVILNRAKVRANKYHTIFIIWIWIYLCYNVTNYLYSTQDVNATDVLISRLEVIALLCGFFYMLQLNNGVYVAKIALLCVTLLGVILNFYDFFYPSMSIVPGRAAGLYINPNISGKVLVLTMIATITLIPKKYRLLYCLFVGLGVFVTFSRSCWISWAVALTGLATIGAFAVKNKLAGVAFICFLSTILVYSLLYGGFLEFSSHNLSEYLTANTLARLGGEGGAFTDDSTYSRLRAALLAWSSFQDHPWLGSGLAYTKEWGYSVPPHNAYLLFAAQGGTFGIIVFLGMLFSLWYITTNVGKVLVIVFAVISLFSHTMLDQPAMLVIISLIANLKTSEEREQYII